MFKQKKKWTTEASGKEGSRQTESGVQLFIKISDIWRRSDLWDKLMVQQSDGRVYHTSSFFYLV